MVTHSCNPSAQEAETEALRSEAGLGDIVRPSQFCLSKSFYTPSKEKINFRESYYGIHMLNNHTIISLYYLDKTGKLSGTKL